MAESELEKAVREFLALYEEKCRARGEQPVPSWNGSYYPKHIVESDVAPLRAALEKSRG